MTEELKGSKNPGAGLEPGDEVFVKATVDGTLVDGEVRVSFPQADSAYPDRTQWVAIRDIRKSPPSEHSGTAELERKVVEAARKWRSETSTVNRKGSTETFMSLVSAIDALNAAFAQPFLEQQITERFRHWENGDEESEYNTTDALIADILALVKVHES